MYCMWSVDLLRGPLVHRDVVDGLGGAAVVLEQQVLAMLVSFDVVRPSLPRLPLGRSRDTALDMIQQEFVAGYEPLAGVVSRSRLRSAQEPGRFPSAAG